MKTAITELITFFNNFPTDQSFTGKQMVEVLEKNLEKEKNQIIDAFDDGLNCQVSAANGKEYVENNFNS